MVTQKNNKVSNGDIVAGDKYVVFKNEIAKARSPIRSELGFDPSCDQNDTTLSRKLKDGKLNGSAIATATRSKVKTLGILLEIVDSDEGKRVVADLYENLIAVINAKFVVGMDPDDLLKTQMSQIYNEFTLLVSKYQDLLPIDEAFLDGLLFIATSNCAMRWRIEG